MKRDLIKRRGLITSCLSLVIIAGGSLPVLAQYQRYPTDVEIQGLIPEFRRQIQRWSQAINPESLKDATSFVAAWQRVDRASAPFLGQWTSVDENKSIYPSNVKGRVCIIDTSYEGARFSLGEVSNNRIRTSTRQVIIKQGTFLGVAGYNQGAGIYPYYLLKTVESPITSCYLIYFAEKAEIIKQFKAAGCTAFVPSIR
jgi:hypothetical protein